MINSIVQNWMTNNYNSDPEDLWQNIIEILKSITSIAIRAGIIIILINLIINKIWQT